MSAYVIITPAHNEEAFIEQTIQSMIQQTFCPLKWIIVNDASTDRTREIVEECTRDRPFIRLVNMDRAAGRDFGKKVYAFNRGLEELHDLQYDFIGNLDADIELEPNYFENILRQFEKDTNLGIAGGQVFMKVGDKFVTHDETPDSVGGQVQLFRRKCFEDIGGYRPLKYGGIDAAAEIMTRMKGWNVRKFPENPVFEHRLTGFASGSQWKARMHDGRRFYSLGYGPMFYLARCVYRWKDPPVIVGSGAALVGYLWSMMRRQPIVLPRDVVRYLKAEHREKLKRVAHLASVSSPCD
ncbi:MAG: glycosyltransferase family A protein [Verrucomicrobiota bacterium]|jgi:glycosyltransferase involved in cell wall biosynthesis